MTVVPTGSTGIGLFIATAFMQAGCERVIITSRKEDGLKTAVDELNAISGLKGRASYIVSNVSSIEGIEKLVEDLKKTLSDQKLHILVNNAAASWGGAYEDFDDWKVGKTLDVNVRAPFNLTRKYVQQHRFQSCILISSKYLQIGTSSCKRRHA